MRDSYFQAQKTALVETIRAAITPYLQESEDGLRLFGEDPLIHRVKPNKIQIQARVNGQLQFFEITITAPWS